MVSGPHEVSVSLQTPDLVVLTGLSGAGKSVALRALEDLDFYSVDNLPASLLGELAARLLGKDSSRLAVGIDARNRPEDLVQLPGILKDLRQQGMRCELIFLQAQDQTLIQRYSETRRRHPLSARGLGLAEAIATERELLEPLRVLADLQVDTSGQNLHQLRRLVWSHLGAPADRTALMLESFAFKSGVPRDADFVFDARCLPNPYWNPDLRKWSGRDAPIREFLDADPVAAALLSDIQGFLDRWIPRFDSDQRAYITVGIGCTGGKHRSVYLIERLAEHFRAQRDHVLLYHRELA